MSSRSVRGPYRFDALPAVTGATYTVTNDNVVLVNRAGAVAITIPAPSSAGPRRILPVIDAGGNAGSNTITITPASGLINGAANYTITKNYGAVWLIDDGSNWEVIGAATRLTATESAYLDGVTAGAGLASKALVLDSAGNVTMPAAGMIALSRTAPAAAGTNQATAAALTEQVNAVTGATGATGVALPAAATTTGPVLVINTVSTSPLLVYPVASGNDQINGLSANSAWELGAGEAAWFVPTSGTQWYCQVPVNRFNHEIVTAANVITAAESGKTFYLNNATGFVSTLPAPALGLRFTFINGLANTSGNHTIVTNGSANIIKGNQNSVAGDAGDFGTSDDTINFVANQSIAGDKVELWSDGTSYFAYAVSKVAAGVTFTTAS